MQAPAGLSEPATQVPAQYFGHFPAIALAPIFDALAHWRRALDYGQTPEPLALYCYSLHRSYQSDGNVVGGAHVEAIG